MAGSKGESFPLHFDYNGKELKTANHRNDERQHNAVFCYYRKLGWLQQNFQGSINNLCGKGFRRVLCCYIISTVDKTRNDKLAT